MKEKVGRISPEALEMACKLFDSGVGKPRSLNVTPNASLESVSGSGSVKLSTGTLIVAKGKAIEVIFIPDISRK